MALVATDILVFPQTIVDTNGKPIKLVLGTLAFDSSYPTGGEAITIANMSEVLGMIINPWADWTFRYIKSSALVIAYVASTGIEVANGTNLSAVDLASYIAWGNP